MPADVPAVARFLNAALNPRIAASTWESSILTSWRSVSPNHGFMLLDGDRVVGAQLAFYSERRFGTRTERFCNVAAFCVLEAYRAYGFRLLAAVLAQKGYVFTDLSPSGNVIALNERLNFRHLDTETSILPNWPWLGVPRRVRCVTDPTALASLLEPEELAIYRDHALAQAARHLAIVAGDEHCYVIFRRDRRKRLPLFASVLHVGNPALFARTLGRFRSHLLFRHGILATLLETRLVGFRPRGGLLLNSPRPKMYRGSSIDEKQIDYLYSELVNVPW